MFSLDSRGELPFIIENTLEAIITRIKKLFLSEHNEDGTHRGVSYSGPVTNITVENGIVTSVS